MEKPVRRPGRRCWPAGAAGCSGARVPLPNHHPANIARSLPPHKLPASRDALLDFLQRTGAPDDVIDAISSLPADREFRTVGEIVRALGIPTEEG
jgi:hypothetical protein